MKPLPTFSAVIESEVAYSEAFLEALLRLPRPTTASTRPIRFRPDSTNSITRAALTPPGIPFCIGIPGPGIPGPGIPGPGIPGPGIPAPG
ncbi:hypothetical protein B1H19_25180 [Streptomyces gilvosporeus]|uniref:Uncharacterized protein n=1 Tax=Streptomyces gilvosporeus TaxID=553510 RepID=A0A1V0TVP3_9ACTN|nr:hypothetical protein B1H19_25180 [Streptomyces gilvosporeus]